MLEQNNFTNKSEAMKLSDTLKEQVREAIRNIDKVEERAPVTNALEITSAESEFARTVREDDSFTIYSTFSPENNGEYVIFSEKED